MCVAPDAWVWAPASPLPSCVTFYNHIAWGEVWCVQMQIKREKRGRVLCVVTLTAPWGETACHAGPLGEAPGPL